MASCTKNAASLSRPTVTLPSSTVVGAFQFAKRSREALYVFTVRDSRGRVGEICSTIGQIGEDFILADADPEALGSDRAETWLPALRDRWLLTPDPCSRQSRRSRLAAVRPAGS